MKKIRLLFLLLAYSISAVPAGAALAVDPVSNAAQVHEWNINLQNSGRIESFARIGVNIESVENRHALANLLAISSLNASTHDEEKEIVKSIAQFVGLEANRAQQAVRDGDLPEIARADLFLRRLRHYERVFPALFSPALLQRTDAAEKTIFQELKKRPLDAVAKARQEIAAYLGKAQPETDDGIANPAHDYRTFTPTDRTSGGSQGGRWFRDQSGNYYFGKNYGGDRERVLGEYLANQIYEEMRVPVSRTWLREINGEAYLFSLEERGKISNSLRPAFRTDAREHFIIDAWLGNWDVLGEDYDNLLIRGRKAVRLDQGGAMFWRAAGGHKPFGKHVDEFDSMRDRNHRSGELFSHLTDAQIAGQIRRFAEDYSSWRFDIWSLINKSHFPPSMRKKIASILDARANWLMTEGMARLRRSEPKDAAGRKERLTEELRAKLGKEWDWNLMEARQEAERQTGAAAHLSDGELVALKIYMGGDFDKINRPLWRGETPLAFEAEIELIKSGLTKLPSYKGMVRRVIALDPAEIARYKVGAIVQEKGFTSTSADNGAPPYDGNINFEIRSKNGKRIEFLESAKEEREVLFTAGAKFKVLSKRKKNGEWFIKMVEMN